VGALTRFLLLLLRDCVTAIALALAPLTARMIAGWFRREGHLAVVYADT
jgi:hypothetical protein